MTTKNILRCDGFSVTASLYIKIWFPWTTDNLSFQFCHLGKEHNFNKYDDKRSDFLNVPYDYNSVMHYSKTAFKNGTDPTIITNIPDFIDVIGQRMDFSEYDLQKLNRLYNCSKFLHLFYISWKNHLEEIRVIHTCCTHPDTSERDTNIFREVNCVKKYQK